MSRLFILSDESPLQLILPIFNNAIAVDIPNTYPYLYIIMLQNAALEQEN